MKKSIIKPAVILSAVALLASCRSNEQITMTQIASPVSVMEIAPSSISKYVNTTGTAQAAFEVTLSSEMAGVYKLQNNPSTGRPYKLGDRVTKGQTIIRFEDREYEIGVDLAAAEVNRKLSKQEYEAQQSLLEMGGATSIDVQRAELSAANAESTYENALIRLARMKVVAPFTGTIVDLPYYTPESIVSTGSAVVSIMDYTKMFMEINMPESAINQITPGQKVAVTHYTLPYDTIPASITEISPAISTETRTFKGKIEIDNSRLLLRPGMFVKADIVVDRAESTIVIPKNTVVTNRNNKYVFVVERNSAIRRNVVTGIEDEDNIQILEGLNIGDNLVVRGQETLRENSPVKIQR